MWNMIPRSDYDLGCRPNIVYLFFMMSIQDYKYWLLILNWLKNILWSCECRILTFEPKKARLFLLVDSDIDLSSVDEALWQNALNRLDFFLWPYHHHYTQEKVDKKSWGKIGPFSSGNDNLNYGNLDNGGFQLNSSEVVYLTIGILT